MTTAGALGDSSSGRVLLADDDRAVLESVSMLLERSGFEVECVEDGMAALETILEDEFDVVLLDLMLPKIDGFEVCRRMRAHSNIPIVMLTARDDSSEIVRGFELGADDYITKPFEPEVMLARVRAVLRRATTDDSPGPLRFDGLEIDAPAVLVTLDGEAVDLTATDFRLLLELARRAGETMDRPKLLRLVWGYDYLGDSRLVDMAVMRLREKLHDDAGQPRFIETVRGVGYRFAGDRID
jgi:two-component system response regulator MtrA